MNFRICCLSLALASSPCSVGYAAGRVALVIGNNHYANLPDSRQLISPVADATDVAEALKSLGYDIVGDAALTNANKDAMITATEQFAVMAKDADAAVFYYSGHGVQVGEDNYLLPGDVPRLTGMSVLRNRSVLLRDSVLVALEEASAKTKVVILDCCRDNPFAAQLESALAQVSKSVKTKSVGEISGYGPGFYLAFATSPGFTANDGNGERNSPFTAAFLKTLPKSAGDDIDFFFRDVKALLGTEQVSWTNHSLTQRFALAAGIPTTASQPLRPSTPAPAPQISLSPVTGSASREKTLIVGVDASYPPFEMLDQRGNLSGVSTDLARALAKELGKQIEFRNISFDVLVSALKTGSVDLIISSMTANEDRRKSIDFSDPYVRIGLGILFSKQSNAHTAEDLKAPSRRVAVRAGTPAEVYVRQQMPNTRLTVLDSDTACIMEVVNGNADACFHDQLSIIKYHERHPDTTRVELKPLLEQFWAIGIRKGNDDLRLKTNDFLKKFRAQGGFQMLADEYLASESKAMADKRLPFVFDVSTSSPLTEIHNGHYELTEVFDGTPYDAYNSYSRGRILTRAQSRLREAGLYQGQADGSIGAGTQSAIIEWQRQQGLPVTGKLDAATQISLGITSITESSPPLPAPTVRRSTPSANSTPKRTTPKRTPKSGSDSFFRDT